MAYRYFPLDDEMLPKFLPLFDERYVRIVEKEKELLKIGAVNESGCPSGVLLLQIKSEGFGVIRYMYTSEPERKKGLMKGMLEYVAPVLGRTGITRLYMLVFREHNKKAEPVLDAFCKSLNGENTVITDHVVSVPASQMIKKTGKTSDQCMLFKDIPSYMLTEAINSIEEPVIHRLNYFIDSAGGDIKKAFDPSSCAIVKDNHIRDLLIFIPREENSGIVLICMKGSNSRDLATMLGKAAKNAVISYGREAYISFATVNGIGKGMAKIFEENREWMQVDRVDFQVEDLL